MCSFILSLIFVMCFSQSSFSGQTIYAKEIEGYMYYDGKMSHSDGQFEITYNIEGDKIIRTRVYDFKKREVIQDNTIYHIQTNLSSDPKINLQRKKRIIRALGNPGTDAIEIISIEMDGEFIQSVKSTSNYFVLSRYKQIK